MDGRVSLQYIIPSIEHPGPLGSFGFSGSFYIEICEWHDGWMKGLFKFIVLLIFLFGTSACDSDKGTPAFADYQKGLDALESGD